MVTEAIPKGYKQTEVGVIPEDWDLITWGDALDFLSTATYSRDQLSENEGICYVHYGDIHTKLNHFLDFEKISLPSINREKAKNYSSIRDGDLIMADASEDYEGIGKSVEVKNIKDRKAISGLHTFLMRGKKELFAVGFKGYLYSNKLIKAQFDRLATGLKVYGVSKNNLKMVLIPCPKPEEQKGIEQVLSDTDVLIEQLDKLLEKKKNIKQGAIQELLTGKRRLPRFKGEWEVNQFGTMIDIEKGQQINKSELLDDGEYPDWNGGIEPSGYTDKWNTDAYTITISEGGNSCGFVNYCKERFWLGGHCYALKIISNGLDKIFLYQLLKFKEKLIMGLRIGSGLPNIQKKNLKEFELYVPIEMQEQSAIAQVLSDMDLEIEELEQKRDKYLKLKAGMMQQLLTGRIRLKC